jgi:hypothetical protein
MVVKRVKSYVRVRFDVAAGERRRIFILANALSPVVVPFLSGGGSAAIGFVVVMLLVSGATAYTIRIDSASAAARWKSPRHLLPSFMRDPAILRWRVLFEALALAEAMTAIGAIFDVGGWTHVFVTWLPAVFEATFRYAAWRIERAEYLEAGLRW